MPPRGTGLGTHVRAALTPATFGVGAADILDVPRDRVTSVVDDEGGPVRSRRFDGFVDRPRNRAAAGPPDWTGG